MGANMRNTIRTSDDDLIVATKVTTDALASATNDLPLLSAAAVAGPVF